MAAVLLCRLLLEHLPLPLACRLLEGGNLFEGDLKKRLGLAEALFVTAERLRTVTDANRSGKDRVAFIAYMPDGRVCQIHYEKKYTKADYHAMAAAPAFRLCRRRQTRHW